MKMRFKGRTGPPTNMSPTLTGAQAFLDAAPIDEVYDGHNIAEAVDKSFKHVQSTIYLLGDEYRFRIGRKYWYGSPKTIKKYKKGRYSG